MTDKSFFIVASANAMMRIAEQNKLDVLLAKTEIAVIIPDLVRFEVLRHIDRPGAREIHDWIREHEPDRVRVASTEEYEELMLILSVKPHAGLRGRAEAAASEVLRGVLSSCVAKCAMLVDDSDLANMYITREMRLEIISVSHLLREFANVTNKK